MTELKSVWVIESGSYSDYSVNGLYSTKELAERARAVGVYYDVPSISEWTIDEPTPEMNEYHIFEYVIPQNNGYVHHALVGYGRQNRPPMYVERNHHDIDYFHLRVNARDKDHAEKIFADEFRMFKSGQAIAPFFDYAHFHDDFTTSTAAFDVSNQCVAVLEEGPTPHLIPA